MAATNVNQWKNISSVLQWFKNLPNKGDSAFISFDVVEFYTVGTSPPKIAQVRHLLCSAVSCANATHCKTMAASLSAEEVRDKVLEDDDEFESEDSDNESEEMEEDAFENDNFFSRNAQKKTCKE